MNWEEYRWTGNITPASEVFSSCAVKPEVVRFADVYLRNVLWLNTSLFALFRKLCADFSADQQYE